MLTQDAGAAGASLRFEGHDMRLLLTVASILAVLALAACDSPATTRHEQAALAAAEKWLARVDAGEHAGTYDDAAPVFKVSIQKEVWESRGQAFNRQLGIPEHRELIAVKYTSTVPGLHSGDHVVVQFRRPVRSAPPVLEIVVMERSGAGWKAATYNILPVLR